MKFPRAGELLHAEKIVNLRGRMTPEERAARWELLKPTTMELLKATQSVPEPFRGRLVASSLARLYAPMRYAEIGWVLYQLDGRARVGGSKPSLSSELMKRAERLAVFKMSRSGVLRQHMAPIQKLPKDPRGSQP